ncbi:MAG: transglycosylase domain-containing protein [Clostridia bacterium]|nr:transglycosylase domain-containing protein [Clostridia bacterium]
MNSRTNNRRRKTNVSTRKNSTRVNSTRSSGPIRSGAAIKGSKKKSNKNNKNNVIKKRIIKAIIIAVIFLFLVLLIAGGVFVGIFFSDKFAMTKEDLLIGYSNTIIYDAEGNVIAELSGKENRKIITINEMSEYLPKAFVSIEDERFYKHKGVDLKRTTAAIATYVTHSGESNFGGSTITQQLVKNITNEKESSGKAGMQRKIREMSRAYQIEKMLTKDQILELYLNLIPLASSGGDICGVETASRYYFNKSASELSIEECAFIAGVTHSPSQYNPYKENPNTERINNRTKTVLGKMKNLGYINEEQYNEAIGKVNEGLKFEKGELPTSSIKDYYVSAAVDEVINDLVEEKGMSVEYARNRVFSGGLKIYTSQVSSIQKTVETEYKAETYVKPAKDSEAEPGAHTQSAMVIIDHKTGKVVGCMGGLGSDVDAIGINRINSARQPGSSIKPIGVYGPAVEKGIINAATIYDNTYPTVFGTKYTPRNASNQKSGLCTIRDAIEVSANIVACKVMTELTPDSAIDFMRDLGITSLTKASESTNGYNDSNLTTALGAVSYGISPLEMAGAYAAIANDGIYIEPSFYTKVEDSAGNIIIESKQESRRVFSEGNAYIMKSLLKQPVEGSQGTARVCRMGNMNVGAKTGTTQEEKDVWLCGFTPYYTAATWVGYDKPERVSTAGGSPATLIWANVMKKIHEGLEAKQFEKPGNVVTATVCRASGKCATSACKDTYTEYFVEGAVPGKCEGHNSYDICSESKKLATEYCPHKETTYGLAMPEKEANAKWKTSSGNKYTIITEKCDIHTAETKAKEDETKVTVEKTNKDTDVTVPNVVGKKEAEAKATLTKLGLMVDVKYNDKATSDDGVVISQNVSANAVVSKNAKIVIMVNRVAKPAQPTQPTQQMQPTQQGQQNKQQ